MPSEQRIIEVKDRLPAKGQWVIAVTPRFRCMAYLDQDGKWRDVYRGDELNDVQGWCATNDVTD
jgi:hypothetical protein